MLRVEQLEQANAALSARNKMLEVTKDASMSKQIREEVKAKTAKEKQRGSITLIKNEIPSDYAERIKQLKRALQGSNLNTSKIRQTELLLRDNGADYFKIEVDDGNFDVKHWGQYDLIWKYHGLADSYIVYIDFD